jgi:DNA-binding transcriptional MerR regulator
MTTTPPPGRARATQPALFEIRSDGHAGYRAPVVCKLAHVTYRQLDYWGRTGLVTPSVAGAHGSGSQRLYSFQDILTTRIIASLLDAGISLQNVRKALGELADRGVDDLAGLTLMSDGTTVYECSSADDVIDLLAGGQGVFGIAVPGLVRELSTSIAEIPAERPDELASRRQARAS